MNNYFINLADLTYKYFHLSCIQDSGVSSVFSSSILTVTSSEVSIFTAELSSSTLRAVCVSMSMVRRVPLFQLGSIDVADLANFCYCLKQALTMTSFEGFYFRI